MSKITKLFEDYGFNVEPFGKEGSYIATNEHFCVPFTEKGNETFPEIAAVTFNVNDVDRLKEQYAGMDIGNQCYNDYINCILKVQPLAGLINHDLRDYEIEAWLMTVRRKHYG